MSPLGRSGASGLRRCGDRVSVVRNWRVVGLFGVLGIREEFNSGEIYIY